MISFITRLWFFIVISSSLLFSQPFWEGGEGPYGGTLLDFAFNSQDHIYGAGYYGIFKSTNNGQKWEAINSEFLSLFNQINNIVIDQLNNIYIATYQGIYKSTDDGATWAAVNNGLINVFITIIDINSSGVLFAADFSNIYRSEDGGANWVPVNNGLPPNTTVWDFAFDPVTNEIFAGTPSGVFSSTDNGDNWTDITSNLPSSVTVTCLALSPTGDYSGDDYIYAGTSEGVYRYSRTLNTWLHLATGLGVLYIYSLAVSQQGDIFAGTATGVFRHLANASEWTQLTMPLIFSYINTLVFTSLGYLIASEDWGGPLLSMDNGNNWTRIITGLTAYGIISFYYAHQLSKFFMGSDAGFFKGLKALTGWQLMYPAGNPFFFAAATVYSLGYLFVGTFSSGIYRSSDEGATWQQINNGLTSLLITALVVNSLGHLYASTQGGGVFFSDNNGDSWSPLNTGLSSLFITCLALSHLGVLYAGTINDGIYKYNNNTSQWEHLTLSGLVSLYVVAMTINLAGDIFAVTGNNELYLLQSNAAAWVALSIAATYIHDIILRRTGSRGVTEEIFVADISGVYSSTDNGSTWELKNTGLSLGLSTSKFAADSSGGIYLAAGGRGAFRGGGGPNIIKITDDELPVDFALYQNYPNPFNPSTAIKFSLSGNSFVKLEVFNSLGEKVETLVSENLSPGSYEYEYKAGELSGGVYFYRISADNFTQTKKFMLLK